MIKFHIERREKAAFSVMFPEAITKDRDVWGQSTIGTTGIWLKQRLVTGQLAQIFQRVLTVAQEYDITRMRKPIIDQMRLYEEMANATPTSLEYWDYAGRIDCTSRDAINVMFRDGAIMCPERNYGVGFRGILIKTSEPWSRDEFIEEELVRIRLNTLTRGVAPAFARLTRDQPMRLRQAFEDEIRDLLRVAWIQYITEPSPGNLESVIAVEKNIHSYLCDTLATIQHGGSWQHAMSPAFPDATGAVELWNQDKIDALDYDNTMPWYMSYPSGRAKQVTMVRKAILSHRTFKITIVPNPMCHSLEHGGYNVAHHLLSYGPPASVGTAVFNQNRQERKRFTPFVGHSGAADNTLWSGNIDEQTGWSVIKDMDAMPEPVLEVRTQAIRIPTRMAERLEAAKTDKFRPTLVWEPLNQATAPMLYLPDLFLDVDIDPLFTEGWTMTPNEAWNSVSGWCTHRTGSPHVVTYTTHQTPGFLSKPVSGRPCRVGAVHEILPL